jgi:hypothetical protein
MLRDIGIMSESIRLLFVNRRTFLRNSFSSSASLVSGSALARQNISGSPVTLTNREVWLEWLLRTARPVLEAAAVGKLQDLMPIEAAAGQEADRRQVTHLEAVGRTLAGIAPWLENGNRHGDEGRELNRFQNLAIETISRGVAKGTTAYLKFGEHRQTIVDAGFLSLALARAPQQLVSALPSAARANLADALRATRALAPPFNNWLLFSAMIEAALLRLDQSWDRMRVDYALHEHASWFLGDGVYGDGPHFHADFYNSYVIHPFLLALIDIVGPFNSAWAEMTDVIRARAARYAVILERNIASDGSFPALGRSITYRCGAFHLLADAALRHLIPANLPPEQVRCALGAVIGRTLGAPGTYDESGWLRIGLAGHQPSLGETYISTGSLYLSTAAFLPLGLPPSDRFWTGATRPWTSQRVWAGQDLVPDHAQDE